MNNVILHMPNVLPTQADLDICIILSIHGMPSTGRTLEWKALYSASRNRAFPGGGLPPHTLEEKTQFDNPPYLPNEGNEGGLESGCRAIKGFLAEDG